MYSDYQKYNCQNKKTLGKPHGGLCWTINQNILLKSDNIFNDKITNIEINQCNVAKSLFIYGLWMAFDDGKQEKIANFQSNLSLIEAEIKLNSKHNILIVEEFNADI